MNKWLIYHCARMYFRILESAHAVFGFRGWFFYYLFKVPMKVMYVYLSMSLDDIFFRGYRQVQIVKPIFIIGHPRSATTFLHTVLTSSSDFLTFRDWEIHHPSLTAGKVFERFRTLRLLASLITDLRFSPHRIMVQIRRKKENSAIGEIISEQNNIRELVAQEEEVLFLNILDTQFLTLETPLGFVKRGYPELCFHDDQPHQERSVRFLSGCFKRRIFASGRPQIMAKINFSLFRIKTLMKVFPDARIIYLVRSPLDTMPSHFSIHQRELDSQFGLENIPPESLRQYFEHRYNYNVLFYRQMDEILKGNVIPKDQLLELTYDSIYKDFGATMRRIEDFVGFKFSADLVEKLRDREKKQTKFKRKHENLPIEAFGYSEENIRTDLAFVFDRYGFK
jgi:hypothetical protein